MMKISLRILGVLISTGLLAVFLTACGSGGGGDDDPGSIVSPPSAAITSPSNGSLYNTTDTISFSGTGNDPEDGPLTGPSLVWTSNIDGEIGTGESLSTTLSAGNHTITLTATDSQGGTGADSINITIQIKAGGWRQKNYDIGGTSYYPFASVSNNGQLNLLWQISNLNNASLLTADLDNDGVLDIVTSDGSSLTAYNGQGDVLWSILTSATLNYIGDLDGDMQPEVGVVYKDGANHLKVDVYNANGSFNKTLDRGVSGYDSYIKILAHFGDYIIVGYGAGYSLSPRGVGILRYSTGGEDAYFATGGGGIWGTFAIGDSDNDGLPEIALPWGTPHNGASANGTTDGDLYGVLVEADITVDPATLNYNFIKPISTWNPSTNPNGYNSAMMPDLDGDNIPEVLFLEEHDSTYYTGSQYVYEVSSSGVLSSTWQGPANGIFPLTTIINDLNSDNIKELVMSARDNEIVSVVDGATFTTISTSTTAGRVLGATDFNGDGQDEIIVHQSSSGNVRVLNGGTLSEIGSWNVGKFTPHSFYYVNRFAISDVTGDGKLELILGASNGLYVLESQ